MLKAVLVNSADKIEDVGDGALLGMTKTLVDRRGNDWLESPVFRSRSQPLDQSFGAGLLNVRRAVQQIEGGRFSPGEILGVGWDYGSVTPADPLRKYAFGDEIVEGGYVSITLAWDRKVVLNDLPADEKYTPGETFTARGATNLNLFLPPSGATDVGQAIWSSEAEGSSVEHIFFAAPTTGL